MSRTPRWIAALALSAAGIWFTGGDQALLTAAIGGTASLRAMHRRYQGGAVVGGTIRLGEVLLINAEALARHVLAAIDLERRLELAFEGDRWPDLVRTGRAGKCWEFPRSRPCIRSRRPRSTWLRG